MSCVCDASCRSTAHVKAQRLVYSVPSVLHAASSASGHCFWNRRQSPDYQASGFTLAAAERRGICLQALALIAQW